MQIVKVLEAITEKFSTNLYDWRRDMKWRITFAVYENGMVEVPERPPMEIKTRYFPSLEEAFKWAEKKYNIKKEDFKEKTLRRFLISDPCEPPLGGPVFFNWRKAKEENNK